MCYILFTLKQGYKKRSWEREEISEHKNGNFIGLNRNWLHTKKICSLLFRAAGSSPAIRHTFDYRIRQHMCTFSCPLLLPPPLWQWSHTPHRWSALFIWPVNPSSFLALIRNLRAELIMSFWRVHKLFAPSAEESGGAGDGCSVCTWYILRFLFYLTGGGEERKWSRKKEAKSRH